MSVYNLYIFNRQGRCLYYQEWNRSNNPFKESPEEDQKLVFGLLFSLKQFLQKLSPAKFGDGLHSISTPSFTLHHFESVSGYRFVLNTRKCRSASRNEAVRSVLLQIYSEAFVPLVIKNPLHGLGAPIEVLDFKARLSDYIVQLEETIFAK